MSKKKTQQVDAEVIERIEQREENQLITIKQAEQELQHVRADKSVFPLTPTHRKELRQLRDRNVGRLRQRLRTIKSFKRDAFSELFLQIKKDTVEKIQKKVEKINADYIKLIDDFRVMTQKHIDKENEFLDLYPDLSVSSNYGSKLSDIDELKFDEARREIKLKESDINNIAQKKFNEHFKKMFDDIDQRIEKLDELYEEAINFGDLEQVKHLYYEMKDADAFLDRLHNITIDKKLVEEIE